MRALSQAAIEDKTPAYRFNSILLFGNRIHVAPNSGMRQTEGHVLYIDLNPVKARSMAVSGNYLFGLAHTPSPG
jgi:hypothetical protein